MPDLSLIELSKYRLDKAREMLSAAQRDADAEDFASANNRAYYCIFHTMRSVLVLRKFHPPIPKARSIAAEIQRADIQCRHYPKSKRL